MSKPPEPRCAFLRLLGTARVSMGAYLAMNGFAALSASPERFFSVTNGLIRTVPMKGTRERFADPLQDARALEMLLSDVKERSELAMIVDLLRSDLNRICVPGTVSVFAFPHVNSIAHVHHLEGIIEGRLACSDFTSIIGAMFPGGSISGCPRIEACRIIGELERQPRGLYTGTIGYLRAGGDMDFSIAIRTLEYHRGSCRFGVGGGITLLSDPEHEWNETVAKGRTLAGVLGLSDWEAQ